MTVIQPTLIRMPNNDLYSNTKKRVAVYARVSTDTEEQLSSYEVQVVYYTRHIKNNTEWNFIKVYTD